MLSGAGPGGLPLHEYRDHRAQLRDGAVLWENNGWSVRGSVDGREFLLWISPYLLGGYPGSAFRLDRASVDQTMLVFADDLGKVLDHPNDFLAVGWEPDEFGTWEDWAVAHDESGVTWSSRDRRILATEDGWRIWGTHAGVELDLVLRPDRPALWLSPPDEPLGVRQDRWWIATALVEGTMGYNGGAHTVEARALHERHIHLGSAYNPVTLLRGQGVTWQSGHTDGLSYSVLARPEMGLYWAQLDVDGRVVDIRDRSRVSLEVTDSWVDPETSLEMPRRWRLALEEDDLRLELFVTAHARAYYLWNFLRDGVTALYWWVCTAQGSLRTADGVRQLESVRAEAHLNKTIYERRPH
jgi:hypothetical protein